MLASWHRARGGVALLVDMVEAVVDLHAAELAKRVGAISEVDEFDRPAGARLSKMLRKGA
jgi:hypothetical protein